MADAASTKTNDDAPTHWSGDGHEEDEIRVHHSNVFLRMMGSMQLSAMGLHGWVAGSTCCCCFPLTTGTVVICALMFLRGSSALFEVLGYQTLILSSESLHWGNPFVYLAKFMLAVGGLGDIIVAICGAIGVFFGLVLPTFVLPVWLFLHCLFGILFTMIVSTLDTMGAGGLATISFLIVGMVIPDIYSLMISLQTLLKVTWKSTVAPSMHHILYHAENLAYENDCSSVGKNHLIAALLADAESRELLMYGGANVESLSRELKIGSEFVAGQNFGDGSPFGDIVKSHDPLPFGPEATRLLAEAAREQWKAYEPRLTADHALLALTSGGCIVLETLEDDAPQSVHPVPRAHAMREFIEHTHREQAIEPGPPPAPAFGCLPVEECVMVYIALQVGLCFLSLFCLLMAGRSLGVVAGLRTVDEMRTVELLSSVFGLVIGCTALWNISNHRQVRTEIRLAAHAEGCRWAAELDEAWKKVRTSKDAPGWLDNMKAASSWLGANLAWNFVQCFLEVPMIFGLLVFGNVCGSYTYGVMRVSDVHLQSSAPMHCSSSDWEVLLMIASWILLKLYMNWCQLALWHEYAYGWTTTELRGSTYLDPFAPLPQDRVRQMAGLPRVPQKRLGHNSVGKPTEHTPLIL